MPDDANPEDAQSIPCEACRKTVCPDPKFQAAVGKPPEQTVWQCPACGHRQVFPIPSDEVLSGYYEYSPEQIKEWNIKHDWTSGITRLAPTYRRRLEFVAGRQPRRGKLLDVGFGNGIFLKSAHELGYAVSGVDADDRYFQPDFPCDLRIDLFRAGMFEPESFDVVASHHVLEHVSDLNATLDEMLRLLKPGGYLVIELPNEAQSVLKKFRRAVGQQPFTYRSIFQHLRYFTVNSLRLSLERRGLKILRCRSIASYEFARFPLSTLLAPLALLEQPGGQGLFLEAIAQKPA